MKYYQERGLLRIFLGYFKPHRKLFALDMFCAFLVAAVTKKRPAVPFMRLTWTMP